MNYSRATRGSSRSRAICEIKLQSELELSRPLSKEEETSLYQKLSPENILDRIQKVIIFMIYMFFTDSF